MSEAITGSTVVTAADQLRAFYWAVPRAARIGFPILVVGLVLLTIVQTVVDGTIELWPSWLMIAMLAWLFMMPFLMLQGHRRLSDAQKQVVYEIDAERILMRDAVGTSVAVPWTLARGCIETTSGFAVAMKPHGLRWLPKRAFRAEQVAALRNLIRQKLGDAAKLDG